MADTTSDTIHTTTNDTTTTTDEPQAEKATPQWEQGDGMKVLRLDGGRRDKPYRVEMSYADLDDGGIVAYFDDIPGAYVLASTPEASALFLDAMGQIAARVMRSRNETDTDGGGKSGYVTADDFRAGGALFKEDPTDGEYYLAYPPIENVVLVAENDTAMGMVLGLFVRLGVQALYGVRPEPGKERLKITLTPPSDTSETEASAPAEADGADGAKADDDKRVYFTYFATCTKEQHSDYGCLEYSFGTPTLSDRRIIVTGVHPVGPTEYALVVISPVELDPEGELPTLFPGVTGWERFKQSADVAGLTDRQMTSTSPLTFTV